MIQVFLLLLFFIAPSVYAQNAPEPVKEKDILPYLEQVISFSHAIADTERLPNNARETILKDALKKNSKKLLQKSFEFANAQILIFDTDKPAIEEAVDGNEPIRKSKLQQAIANNNKSIEELRTKLTVPKLKAPERERVEGELKLAIAHQSLLKTMSGIFNSEESGTGSLADQIKVLTRSELDILPDQITNKEAVVKIPPKEDEDTQDAGMLKLSTAMFSFSHKQSQIEDLIDQNKALKEKNRAIASSIRAVLRSAIDTGKSLSNQSGNDAKSMVIYRKSLNDLMAKYKLLSAAIIPIGEINVTLESSLNNLQEWDKLITEDWSHILRQLILRLVILSVAVVIPLIASSVAHRAIMRYFKDQRRQKQLNIVRRIILITILAFVILANFISEFGSLATFAGFITAGLAVALQTVLVSLVGHFFFFGRYGIKIGDRVTLSNVTGDVIQVGVLRLYIRELQEKEGKWVPSGKMVAFPNSILFQPTAFYKHIGESEISK